MKVKFSITQGFLMVMLLILALVSAIGFVTYLEFVKVLDNAKESGKPDPTVALTKNLIFSVTDAENKVKTYTLTEDSLFIVQYQTIRSKINDQLSVLDTIQFSSPKERSQLDTLSKYVQFKLDIYDSLLLLQNEFRVQQALERVNKTIEGAVEEVPSFVQPSTDNLSETTEAETEEERKFLFFKLKSRSKRNRRKDTEEEPAPTLVAAPEEIPTEIRVNYETVKNNLAQIQNSETTREEQQLMQEYQLLELDKLYSAQLSKILAQLENKGLKRDQKRGAKTKTIVQKANIQIVIFCVLISVLLVITSYVIIRYISRSNRYRKILKRAKNEAESLAQAKEHFVATVSHEIRTPMNIISGFTEQLSHSSLDKQQRDQLETVIKASSHLLQLINEVLDFTKLQNYKLELESRNFKLRETIHEVRDLMTPLAADKEIDLEFIVAKDAPNILLGDSIRLSQMLINVTSNAVKFTEKGMVSVTVTPLQIGDKVAILEFAITDTGIGMSPEKMERVFEAFEQAEASTSRTYGGTGLGLSITKKLVELHNGSVEVHSKENVGTEIVIEIPYTIGEMDNEEIKDSANRLHPTIRKKRILVADDEVFNRKLIVTILNKFEAIVEEAENGNQAVELAMNNKYDLILMDARMPQLDGVDATKAIRLEGLNADTSIIALSAAVTSEDKKAYYRAGMNTVLGKPFRESDLLKVMSEQLSDKDTKKMEETIALDFEGIRSLSGDDDSFYVEMLETFIRGTHNGIEEMNQLRIEGNIKRVGEIAHRISAPCKHMEATALYEVLKEIEHISQTETPSPEQVEELLTLASRRSEATIKTVQQELNRQTEK
jgi:signal transduction histidine kinase/FixJ family two-component response regulator